MPLKIPFRLVNVSSEDENFPAVELNHHSPYTRGWVSSRFCTFPQRIVIALDQRARLCKIQILCHQYLIASKVEFFVGDVADGTKFGIENTKFVRLGYVSLSDNESTKFKARELKSVHVDAVATCVQLVLHKNHSNKYNIYNQVGLVAVNVIGDAVVDDSPSAYGFGSKQRPDFIPPTEDLAFDIYQDPEVANIIRRLEKQKLTFVAEEKFDEAQKLRNAIGQLQHIGERLGRLALEKQHAVDEENYERAKLKKYQIDEIRANLYRIPDLADLLTEQVPAIREQSPRYPGTSYLSNGTTSNHSGNVERIFSNPPYSVDESYGNAEDRPLPALRHRNNNAASSNSPDHVSSTFVAAKESQATDHESSADDASERIEEPPADRDSRLEEQSYGSSPDEAPEPLSETHRRLASLAIDVVGIDLVTKLFSKSWTFRQEALTELETRVCAPTLPQLASSSESDALAELRSTSFILQKALQDQVLLVFRLGCGLIKSTIVDFADRYAISRADLYHAMEKLISVLFSRMGDHSGRIRELARSQISLIAQWPQLRQCTFFWHELVRPFSTVTLDRLALSRVETVTELYASLGVENPANPGGFSLDSLAAFTAKALHHRSNEVREAAETLMVALYRAEDRALIRRSLPPNNINTLRHPLFRRLFSKFDRIDEKYAPIGGMPPDSVKKKQKEYNALQADVENLRTIVNHDKRKGSNVPNPVKTNKTRNRVTPSIRPKIKEHPSAKSKSNASRKQEPKLHTPESPPTESQQTSSNYSTGETDILSLEKTCIFCGEQRDDFTEDGLDLHYWKECPMLQQCSKCNQVVEIANLSEHLCTECEVSPRHVQCDRCSEAVLETELKTHACSTVNRNSVRCPLCHTNLSLTDPRSGAPCAPEDIWKAHLMGSDPDVCSACPKNPRRPISISNALHLGSQHTALSANEHPNKGESKNLAGTRTLIPRPKNASHIPIN